MPDREPEAGPAITAAGAAAGEGDARSGAHSMHAPPRGFWRRYLFSTDHKVIGRQFLFLGLAFLAVGGFLAMLIRWQLANPGVPFPLVGKLIYAETGGVISRRRTPRSSPCTARS